MFASLNTNGDMKIDMGDNLDADTYDMIMACNEDDNLVVDICELYNCMVRGENEWRIDNCPSCFGLVTCDERPECDCGRSCADIYALSETVLANYDVDG
jgi:hypothetical protein